MTAPPSLRPSAGDAREERGRVLMLYPVDWTRELADYRRGEVPSHRLFGFAELERLGYRPALCRPPRPLRRLVSRSGPWRVFQALWALRHQRQWTCVVATTESPALPLLVLKALGLFRRPIVCVSVALLHPKNLGGVRRRIWVRVLPRADAVVVYASAQRVDLARSYGLDEERVTFVPFGVDVRFFSPAAVSPNGRERIPILSVGTNEGKDFPTLMRALPPGSALLAVTDEGNAAAIERSAPAEARVAVESAVPIRRLRQLYVDATVHVIPLRETRFSSGQTVLLENMALGKLVLVSDVSAVRDYVDGETALLVPPGDPRSLRVAISASLSAPELRKRTGTAAAERVRREFSSERFGYRLAAVIDSVSREAALPSRREARRSASS